MEDIDDDELPEALRLHQALAIAVLALELIAEDKASCGAVMARAALKHLRRRHPDAREHMTPGSDCDA